DDCRPPFDPAESGGEGVLVRIGGAGLLEAVGVPLGIAKLQRVFVHLGLGQQLVTFIQKLAEPGIGADAAMMFAARADAKICLVFLAEQHVVAAWALDPEIVRSLT